MASSSSPSHSFLYSRRLSGSLRPRNANPYDAVRTSTLAPPTPQLGSTAQNSLDVDEEEWDSQQEDGNRNDGDEDEEEEEEEEDDDDDNVDDDDDDDDGEDEGEDRRDVEVDGVDEEGAIEEGNVEILVSTFCSSILAPIYVYMVLYTTNRRRAQKVLHLEIPTSVKVMLGPSQDTPDAAGVVIEPFHWMHWKQKTILAMDIDTPFDATGLKEIGNLASWTVSTCKPGCGVEALRDEDTNMFWQSDGPQPHHLNIHFSRLVPIVSIRLYLDFEADESYTPTRITLLAGTGYHDLIPFSSLEFAQPKGWIDIPLEGVGGGPDGNTLMAFLVQVKVVENHQNGKDTHLRGLKIYAKDETIDKGGMGKVDDVLGRMDKRGPSTLDRWDKDGVSAGGLTEPDWMGDAELR
ncbi:MAG: anaphase promoting complex subunit doc1 [Claussenomyces sp. TS43310]|nr:MAG: anaphase promoting complex subunit doc1 [Claussenomyces sp. TS43310]